MMRGILAVIGVVGLVFTLGLFIQAPWATVLWPIPAGRLSYIFLSSILAAASVPILWIAISGELRAMLGGAINLGVTYAAFFFSAILLYLREPNPALFVLAVFSLGAAVACAAMIWYARRQPFHDSRPTPGFVRFSFALFAILLALTGGSMVLQRPDIFPWPITPESSVFFGWIFLGAMCYFLFGLVYAHWANARGQLLGFLAYDLILIVPFLQHLQTVRPDLLFNLIVYIGVLVFSGTVAVYFLFLHPTTRFRTNRKASVPAGTATDSL